MPTAREPIVCYVTGRKSLGADASPLDLAVRMRTAIAAGADWVQIREKDLPAREVLGLARAAHREAAGRGTLIFVNDRLDVALAAGAAGVHLGGESLPATDAIRWCRAGNAPAGFRVGVSCHSVEDVREAEGAGADYVFFGPVFDTPAKRKFGAPQGIAKLAEVCSSARIPVIAIGGVDAVNAKSCIAAGAAGIAAIRMFQEQSDPAKLSAVLTRLRRASAKL